MDQNIKKQWVEALRSGKYKQGRCWLKYGDEFCCLGVLCDLHAQTTNREWEGCGSIGNYLDHAESLPEEVVQWAGLNSKDPFINEKRVSIYNDERGLDFDQMSDLIESNL